MNTSPLRAPLPRAPVQQLDQLEMSWRSCLAAVGEKGKPGKLPLPSQEAVRLRLRLPRKEIAYLKFIIESYEGITVVRTEDRKSAKVMLLVAPDFLSELWEILEVLGQEIPIEVLD